MITLLLLTIDAHTTSINIFLFITAYCSFMENTNIIQKISKLQRTHSYKKLQQSQKQIQSSNFITFR